MYAIYNLLNKQRKNQNTANYIRDIEFDYFSFLFRSLFRFSFLTYFPPRAFIALILKLFQLIKATVDDFAFSVL